MFKRAIILLVSLFWTSASQAMPSLNIPARRLDAMSGSEFLKATRMLSPAAREQAIAREIANGNVPKFMRQLKPVTLDRHTTIWVTPDYLAIGSDQDFVRIPMTPITAQQLADRFGAVLPTPKIVDAIQRQASKKLSPLPLSVRGASMTSNDAYARHNKQIEQQLRGQHTGHIVSGHKKDVVLTNRLVPRPYRVAIYGWHRKNGKAIQPLSLVHHNLYADYSHGIRLVAQTIQFHGRFVSINQALSNHRLASSLSYEKNMRTLRLATQSGPSQQYRFKKFTPHQPKLRLASYRK